MAKKTFQVIVLALNVRSEPDLEDRLLVPNAQLHLGDRIETEPATRTENEEIVWWQHSTGWSAERRMDNTKIYMVEVLDPQPIPEGDTITFYIVEPILNIREAAGINSAIKGALYLGQKISADANSRTVKDGSIWWKHRRGWCAERREDNSRIFMTTVKPDVPGIGFSFQQIPVNLANIAWIQCYGNTQFAFDHGADHNYNGYSQGLHGGLDLGGAVGTTVFAGVHGRFEGPGTSFGPNRLDVTVGKYRILYGHLGNPNPLNLNIGDPVTPTTPMGQIESSQGHTHIEIRTDAYILNPFLIMPQAMVDSLTENPNFGCSFYHSNGWNQWQTPLDQPTILRGGPIIGPKAV